MPSNPYAPTNEKPHPWCAYTHKIAMALCVTQTILLLLGSLLLAVICFGVGWASTGLIMRIAHGRSMEEVIEEGDDEPRIIRPGWLRVAVGVDMTICIGLFAILVFILTPASDTKLSPTATVLSVLGNLALTLFTVLAHQYTHRRATQPRQTATP